MVLGLGVRDFKVAASFSSSSPVALTSSSNPLTPPCLTTFGGSNLNSFLTRPLSLKRPRWPKPQSSWNGLRRRSGRFCGDTKASVMLEIGAKEEVSVAFCN